MHPWYMHPDKKRRLKKYPALHPKGVKKSRGYWLTEADVEFRAKEYQKELHNNCWDEPYFLAFKMMVGDVVVEKFHILNNEGDLEKEILREKRSFYTFDLPGTEPAVWPKILDVNPFITKDKERLGKGCKVGLPPGEAVEDTYRNLIYASLIAHAGLVTGCRAPNKK